jgi:molybdopterin-biosynthesis enzyme MoeA-like protein
MPGIPRELMAIYDAGIHIQLAEEHVDFFDETFFSRGAGESIVADFVVELMQQIPGIWIKSHPKGRRKGNQPIVEWQVTTFGGPEMKDSVDQAIAAIKEEVLRLGGQLGDQDDFE